MLKILKNLRTASLNSEFTGSNKNVIERLQNLGSTPNAVVHRCVVGKDT